MKNLFARIAETLKKAGFQSSVLDALAQTDLNVATIDTLKSIKGIGEKRANLIMNLIMVEKAKSAVVVRESVKVDTKVVCRGYNAYCFPADELWKDVPNLKYLKEFKVNDDEPDELVSARIMLNGMEEHVLSSKLTVDWENKTVIRMNRSDMSDIIGVSYAETKPTNKLFTVEYGIQNTFNLNWKLFDNDEDTANKKMDEFYEAIDQKLSREGVTILCGDKSVVIRLVAASSSHLKKEVGIFCTNKTIKAHEYALFFGQKEEDFWRMNIDGVSLLKMRAVFLRPNTMPLTCNGKRITLNDILVVKSVSQIALIKNGVKIGKVDGKLINYGEFENARTFADGQIHAIYPIDNQGQSKIIAFKGLISDQSSSLAYTAKKYGMTLEEILDCMVESITGLRRLGDYKLICSVDCWKFDKAFGGDYNKFLVWADMMNVMYPGITDVCLLRQAEDAEGEEKHRTISRCLEQMLMTLSPKMQRKLTKRTRMSLKKVKTFLGVYNMLSGAKAETKTAINELFTTMPGLIMNENVQAFLKSVFDRRFVEALSGKIKTTGQYPYICEDPVAVWEVWLFHKDPADPTIGVLVGDEVSLSDVPDGREMVVLRYPANDMTAKVMKNRACVEAFASMNNIMAISVHSDLLVRQDGDVDGDEAAAILDNLVIKLIKDMIKKFNPPVVLFAHGEKGKKPVFHSVEDMYNSVGTALFVSKKYDTVGLYANLSSRCAYLASIAIRAGKMDVAAKYIEYMHAASVGAIMAIDQVKGNQIDPELIAYLKEIDSKTKKMMTRVAEHCGRSEDAWKVRFHYTKQFELMTKGRVVRPETICPFNKDSYIDEMAQLIHTDVGTWDTFDNMGIAFNVDETRRAILNHNVPDIAAPQSIVTREMYDALKDNWFVLRKSGDDRLDMLRDSFKIGEKMSVKDVLEMMCRNEIAASYRMNGKTLAEKKDEYRKICHGVIEAFVDGTEWVEAYGRGNCEVGHVYTLEEKMAIVSNYALGVALEIRLNNGKRVKNAILTKAGFVMFILGVFAEEAIENIKANNLDNSKYFNLIDKANEELVEEEIEEESIIYNVTTVATENELDFIV